MWKRQNELHDDILFTNEYQGLQDDRIYVNIVNFTYRLIVTDIDLELDVGTYSCTLYSKSARREVIEFRLDVLYPPRIDVIHPEYEPHISPSSARIRIFNETDNATFSCIAEGNPKPMITWKREGNPFPEDKTFISGDVLTIQNISRYDGGKYICEASQHSEEKASDFVSVLVQYPPTVIIDRPVLHAGAKTTLNLECKAYGRPAPHYEWLKDGVKIPQINTDKTIVISSPSVNTTSLYIFNVNPAVHYGIYTCRLMNILGVAEGSFTVDGKPTKAEIISPQISSRRNFYTLRWAYLNPQDDTTVLYFNYCYLRNTFGRAAFYKLNLCNNANALRFNVSVPTGSTTSTYKAELRDLFSNAEYLLEIYANNQYGKGEVVKFIFSTIELDMVPTPQTCTMALPDVGALEQQNGDRNSSIREHSEMKLLVILFTTTVVMALTFNIPMH